MSGHLQRGAAAVSSGESHRIDAGRLVVLIRESSYAQEGRTG